MSEYEYHNENHDSHTHSHSRINILPIIFIFGILFVLFKYDIKSIVNNPQLNTNISYVKTTVLNWWHEVGIPQNKGIFSQFFDTQDINPLDNTPGINSFLKNFTEINNPNEIQNIIEDQTQNTTKNTTVNQLNTWSNNPELNNTNEIIPTHQ